MKISSLEFGQNEYIPEQFTCDGADQRPTLKISEVPAGARSLAVIVDDPDAPNGDWVHWIIWNISPEDQVISADSFLGESIEGMTDFGKRGYGGPCPPQGTHRYYFKVYALDAVLDLDYSSTKADLEDAMDGHIVDKDLLIGLYTRNT